MTHIVGSAVEERSDFFRHYDAYLRKSTCELLLRKINHVKHEYRTMKDRKCKNYDPQKLCNEFKSMSQLYVMLVPNSSWSFLKNVFRKSFKEDAPIINKCVKGCFYLWLIVEVKAPINSKGQLHRKAIETNKVTDWKIYKKGQKHYNIMVQCAKKSEN